MKKTGLVFAHTHWDIEWYLPFQSFRFWLVDILDRFIELCARNPRFKTFVLDGQVAPVEHYLEFRPEKEAALRRLVRTGRLAIGPFYTQFDEWLTSPEAIIRNCLAGNRRAREFGGVMKAGYLPDNFGHPRQMPQILAGFGLGSLIFARGMPNRPAGVRDQFYWQGLDGSRVLCVHLSKAYSNARALGSRECKTPLTFETGPYGDHFFIPEAMHLAARNRNIEAGARDLIAAARRLARECPSGVIPLANGMDHAPAQEHLPEMIARANRLQNGIRFRQGDCAGLAGAIRRARAALPTYRGALEGCRYQYLLSGTLTTRAYIKQQNFIAESLLEKYAEPIACLAALAGRAYPRIPLETAWRSMFLNHAHDGIHGSSADAVHLEMMQRYAAVRQIAMGLCHAGLGQLLPAAPRAGQAPPAAIIAYNPVRSSAPVAVDVWAPAADDDFHIEDCRGRVVRMQRVANPLEAGRPPAGRSYCQNWPRGAFRRVVFTAPIAPHGCGVFRVVPGKADQQAPRFKPTASAIENRFFRVAFRRGALDIYDKETRRLYAGLNVIEDEADGGDAWDFSEPWLPNRILRSVNFPSVCRLVESGPVRSSLRIDTAMVVPLCLQGEKRSRATVKMPVTMRVALLEDVRRVDVAVELDNRASDHRVRLKCPTGIRAAFAESQGHFGVIRRPLRSPHSGRNWKQPPPAAFHFREWVAVDDRRHGLAIAARGLYEYETRPGQQGVTLYVTLLRGIGCMGKINLRRRAGSTSPALRIPGAQCHGRQIFEYALLPYDARPGRSRHPFLPWAQGFLYPPVSHVRNRKDPPGPRPDSAEPLFRLEPGNLLVSCFKRAADDDAYILRFWENEGMRTRARLALAPRFGKVYRTDLNERTVARLRPRSGRVELAVPPYKIVTLKLKAGRRS